MHTWSSLPVHNINTGLGYTTIQEVINVPETLDRHTIFVEAGTYYENVVVNKTVSLIGENRETTIIDGNKTGSVVAITVNNVSIIGFTVQNSGPRGSSGYGPFDCGIFVSSSSEICITENVVTNNSLGIYFDMCSNNTLRNNNLTRNTINLLVGGDLITYGYLHMLHDIDETNIVNESPIYYWIGEHDKQIPYDAGCIYLVNSTNITVKDIEITNSLVCLVSTNNSIVENVKVNFGGISLGLSQDNIVTNNTLTNGAIALTWSPNNAVSYNVVSDFSVGMYLYSSYWWAHPNNNFILGNTIANCAVGISIPTYADCNNNTIYHNNFINNTKDVDSHDSINFWDNGFEGNYWSDHNGIDSDCDGIGDTSYVIDDNNQDNYPLMGIFHSFNTSQGYIVDVISNSTINDFEYFESNSTVKMYVSNMTSDQTFGFCRVRIPHDLMNETVPITVLVNGTEPCYWNYTLYDDGNNRWIYFEYEHSTLEIVIVPEFSSFLILPLFIIISLLYVITRKRFIDRLIKDG
jgi:parallel beta-helix repeat protein